MQVGVLQTGRSALSCLRLRWDRADFSRYSADELLCALLTSMRCLVFPLSDIGAPIHTPTFPSAIIWYNLEPESGRPDATSFHAGCDVTRGEKWAANNWFHNRVPQGFVATAAAAAATSSVRGPGG